MDVTATTGMTTKILQEFQENESSQFGKFLWRFIEFKKEQMPDLFLKYYSMFHDAVVIAYAIDPTIFVTQMVHVDLDTKSEISYGRTNCDLNNMLGGVLNVKLATSVDVTKYWDLVMVVIRKLHQQSLGKKF